MYARKAADSLMNGTAPSDSGSSVCRAELMPIKRIMPDEQNVLGPGIEAVGLTIIGPRGKTAYHVRPNMMLTSDALNRLKRHCLFA